MPNSHAFDALMDPLPTPSDNPRAALAPGAAELEFQAQSVLETLIDSVVTIDRAGKILWANPSVETMFGWPREGLIGQNVSLLMPEPFASEHGDYLKNYMKTGVAKVIGIGREVVGRRIDGSLFPIDLTVTRFQSGETTYFTGVIRDITARKNAEEQLTTNTRLLNEACSRLARQACELRSQREKLLELSDEVKKASLIKTQFLANVSHELRTPLTAILGYADLLTHDAAAKAFHDDVEIIRRNGEILLSIINDILDLSQLESGLLKPRRTSFSPRALCEEVRAVAQNEAREKKLDFSLEFVGSIPVSISSDPARLRQILLHLVGNAIKFTREGSVTLRLSCSPGERSSPPQVRFEVLDTGIGIPPEAQERLFQPFSQVDPSLARPFGGTGMGLAISQRLAKLLGGSLSVTSSPGKGSAFALQIDPGALQNAVYREAPPLPQPAQVAAAIASAKPQPTEASKPKARRPLDARILIVEDIPSNQKLIEFHLRRLGARTCLAMNGAEALQAMAAAGDDDPIRLIILDMQMPVMDGYEAARRLRKSGYKLPIIALTASTMDGDRERCLEAGCTDYLAKPIDHDALVMLAASLLMTASMKPPVPAAR